jgi:hypothetical protein
MYLRRVQEMFKKAVTMESTFNAFDEVFHGIAQTSSISENLHSVYEAFLTVTQYYQHSQAGRGSLVAKLLEQLGTSDRMEFEFVLSKLPEFLKEKSKSKYSGLVDQKFDIASRKDDNLVLCELKMKVYSGCSAGRIELMEKFNKFVKLILGDEQFRLLLKKGGVKHVYLIGGVLFDISGSPATKQKDEEFGICYNGLMRAKRDIVKTLSDRGTKFDEIQEAPERAFVIKFEVDEIRIDIVAVYGNEVIKDLFVGKQTRDIGYFKQQLEKMLYDDLWLGQIITLSERAILDQNFKTNKSLVNFITTMLGNDSILAELKRFGADRSEDTLEKVTTNILKAIETSNQYLVNLKLIPALFIMRSSGEDYSLEDYVADLVQFLSCADLMKDLRKEFSQLFESESK